MHSVNFKDAFVRAVKTGVAVFLVSVPVEVVVKGDAAAIEAGAILAGAAVLTFVWNVLLDWTRTS